MREQRTGRTRYDIEENKEVFNCILYTIDYCIIHSWVNIAKIDVVHIIQF